MAPVEVVVIIGHYAQHWRALPVAAWRDGRLFVFADHRTTLTARQDAIREKVSLADVGSFEVFFADATSLGCDEGAHEWQPVVSHALIVAGHCVRCDHMEIVEPVRAAVFVERALARP